MDDFFEGGEEGWGVSLKNNPDYMMCRIYRISLNYDPYLFSKYQSLVFNGVIKWNYMKGSNLFIVYTNRKSVNGDHGGNIFSFNEKKPWTQVFRDQGLMIKIDYWFER